MKPELFRTIDVFLEGAKKPLIVVLGPTASGKTALSIEIAKHVDGEVVNADSRQLYRHLDIGTAKITEDEMSGIPHHLIDVKDPKEEVTVGWYQEEAAKAIDDILIRGKVSLLVGGSMLYISSIIDGLSLAPTADPSIRRNLEEVYDADGGTRLYKRLQKVDPDAAATIHPNNRPYVIRALEIYETLKRPKSKATEQKKCSWELLIFGVERSKEELQKRIYERTERMLECGWVDEVRGLLAQGYAAEDPGMQSHGYREIMQYLSELEEGCSEIDLDMMKEQLNRKIITKTRQYAKRQLTWWRNDPRIRWIHSPHPNFSRNVS